MDDLFYSESNSKINTALFIENTPVRNQTFHKSSNHWLITLFNDKLKGLDNVVVLSGTVEERLNTVKKTVEDLGKDIII